MSSFKDACEKLETSENFRGIRELSLENVGKPSKAFDLEKFREGSKRFATWLGQNYGRDRKA